MPTNADRITELQGLNTAQTNEIRMLRAQLRASKMFLQEVLIDRPLANVLALQTGEPYDIMRERNSALCAIYERIELLEKDAWTQTTQTAKEFVAEGLKVLGSEPLEGFVDHWVTKFQDILG